MKSYNNLFNKMLSDEAIEIAIKNATKNKHTQVYIMPYLENRKNTFESARTWLTKYQTIKHRPVEIYDGISRKKRTIIVPSTIEIVVQHSVVQVLMPIFMKGMYQHSYASIPNRGAHKAKKYIEKCIRKDPRNVKYCLKMDIRHFFESISHDILKNKLKKIIRDEKMLDILYKIIDTTEHGLPLGFYTSQWLANWYLQGLDHYIKEQLHAKYYVRYMDDMVIFGSNKRELHKMLEAIRDYLNEELKLEIKDNWQIFRFDYTDKKGKHRGRDLDFMGFRFFRYKTILRRSIMLKASRKAKKIYKKEKPTVYELRQFISYLGWIKATDTYNFYLKHIKPYVAIQYCKRRISRYQKRVNKEVSNVVRTAMCGC